MFPDRDGWRVQWTDRGRRLSKKFQSKAEARKFEIELELGIAAKPEKDNPTFAVFAKRWLTDYSRVEKRASSHDEDTRVVRRHLVPAFEGRRVGTLRKTDLVELKSQLLTTTAKGRKTLLTPKSVNNILMVAKKILGYAVELDLLPENPWRGVKPCKTKAATFDFWLPEERDEFYAKAKLDRPDIADLALLACHTGLRRGELAALTWGSVDFRRAKLKVSASYSLRVKALGQTKGGETAEVPLNSVALKLLKRRAEAKEGTTVFPTALFKNLRRDFRTLCRRVGVREIRWHDTRHSCASHLAMAGVDLLVIQQLLRHKSYQMTLRYAHLHPSHLAGATEVLVTGCTQNARREENEKTEKRKLPKSMRTLSDSNARPSGSKKEDGLKQAV
jgi:integrase